MCKENEYLDGITESYKSSNGKGIEIPELKTEKGVLSIAGISKTLGYSPYFWDRKRNEVR